MVDPNASLILVTMRLGQPNDRSMFIITLPKFYGELGCTLNYHVRKFITNCNENSARTPDHWHAIFPTTLDGHARQWFHRQPWGHFDTWTALRDAFITKFRPVAYNNWLTEQYMICKWVVVKLLIVTTREWKIFFYNYHLVMGSMMKWRKVFLLEV